MSDRRVMDQKVVGLDAGSRESAIEVLREMEREFGARVEGREGRCVIVRDFPAFEQIGQIGSLVILED